MAYIRSHEKILLYNTPDMYHFFACVESDALSLLPVAFIVGLFDFTNGFHDAADMVAITARAMGPATTSTIASCFTFIAPCAAGLVEVQPARAGCSNDSKGTVPEPASLFKGDECPEAGVRI